MSAPRNRIVSRAGRYYLERRRILWRRIGERVGYAAEADAVVQMRVERWNRNDPGYLDPVAIVTA